MKNWEYLENKSIADIAVKAKADSFEKLLQALLEAFFEISIGSKLKKGKALPYKYEVLLEGEDEKEVIIFLFDELIFLKDVKGLLFPKGRFSKINKGVKAELFGDKVEKFPQGVDIKALSLHGFKFQKKEGFYKVELVFDV